MATAVHNDIDVDTGGWTRLSRSPYGGYFLVAPGILATVPDSGQRHTTDKARDQLDRLHAMIRRLGMRCGNLVFVDRVAGQSAEARRIWSQEADAALLYGCALVCSSPLARAIGTFFMGIRRPTVETRMFGEWTAALAWLHTQNDAFGGPL